MGADHKSAHERAVESAFNQWWDRFRLECPHAFLSLSWSVAMMIFRAGYFAHRAALEREGFVVVPRAIAQKGYGIALEEQLPPPPYQNRSE